jgi:hypothetical protein
MIAMNVRNQVELEMQFVSLVEIRDESGATIFLAWQTGELPAADYMANVYNNTTMSFSWLTESPATYEARTFVISNLENPQILSPVERAEITVT